MQLGNFTDLLVNITLAWLSSLCLFWSMSLLILSFQANHKVLGVTGGTFILTSFYFATISVSTGVMIEHMNPVLVSLARTFLFLDMSAKTILTLSFFWRRRQKRTFHDFMNLFSGVL